MPRKKRYTATVVVSKITESYDEEFDSKEESHAFAANVCGGGYIHRAEKQTHFYPPHRIHQVTIEEYEEH